MKKLQITFFDKNKKYRPIARIIEVEDLQEYENNRAKYQQKAILSICHTMHITPKEFTKQGYTLVKADLVENIELKRKARALKRAYEKRINKGE